MVIKGTSRANPKQLAFHLQRTDTNERVRILELNAPTDDLATTFRDWQLLAGATSGDLGLYHANISPDTGYAMTEEQWERAADVLAEKLGLSHQPRTVILHEKDGREHIHVVWQRTDTDTMTLVSDSWNYLAHEEASLALEQEFGHELVPGKHAKRDRDLQPEFPRAALTHEEWQQAERIGRDPKELKAMIQQLYQQSDHANALKNALSEQGFMLAAGDRGYALVDGEGGIYNLARQLEQKKRQVDQFMAPIPLSLLPTVEEAQKLQRDAKEIVKEIMKQQQAAPKQAPPKPEPAPPVSQLQWDAKKFFEEFMKQHQAAPQPEPPVSQLQWDAKKFFEEFMKQHQAAPQPEPPVSQLQQEAKKFFEEMMKQQQDKPASPAPKEKDPQIERLEQALRERHARETRERNERNKIEIERLKQAHKTETEELLEARRRVQKLELGRFYRKAEEHSDEWVKKFWDVIQQRWNPAAAEQQRIERQQKIDEMNTRHRIERETLIETRKIQRDAAIEEIKHRHSRDILEQDKRNKAELARYHQEQADARKIYKEMEEQRQKEERDRKPDEPGPPKRSL